MTTNGWIQIGIFLALILAITKPLGVFMAKVFSSEHTFLDPVARPIERMLYRVTGVDEKHEMRWTEYAFAMLLFSGATMLLLYLIERVQHVLPLNPQKFGAVAQVLAFNTASSFTTNTNWQNYSGESTMSYLTITSRRRRWESRSRLLSFAASAAKKKIRSEISGSI
jgi:K+-transporting ATPase ATPase A chain